MSKHARPRRTALTLAAAYTATGIGALLSVLALTGVIPPGDDQPTRIANRDDATVTPTASPSPPSTPAQHPFRLRPPRGAALDPTLPTDPRAVRKIVCDPTYNDRNRPPSSYTNRIKVKQLRELGYPDQNVKNYEEDHFIPLSLGGHGRSELNLWPEPRVLAKKSDVLEAKLARDHCACRIDVFQARERIITYKYELVEQYNRGLGRR